jgi:signal transduction histidine kinase
VLRILGFDRYPQPAAEERAWLAESPVTLKRFNIWGYVVAILLALLAVVSTVAARQFFGGWAPLTLFTIAVTIAVTTAASYGGFGPGILTTFVSVGSVALLSANSMLKLLAAETSLWLLGAIGIVISAVIEGFRRRNRDLTEAKEALEILNRELGRRSVYLTQSNEELKRFVYALSHDLKTPMRTISLFAERLAMDLGDNLDEDGRASLGFIQQGAAQAQAMIRRLLEYAMAANQDRIETETDLNHVLAGALTDLQVTSAQCGARITSGRLPMIRGDGDALRQLFLNLIANALKYRSERPPEIHVTALKTGLEWTIRVQDNGIGIDQKYAHKVFELFERLHNASAYEGSGIGLAICRKIVQRHGGIIWVESKSGRGCMFCFTLPLQEDAATGAAAPVKQAVLALG